MANYDFKSLSPADFEDFARDIMGAKLGITFEAFGPGPDGGIDGRHGRADGTIILQAKHYARSGVPSLVRRMKIERKSIDKLSPSG